MWLDFPTDPHRADGPRLHRPCHGGLAQLDRRADPGGGLTAPDAGCGGHRASHDRNARKGECEENSSAMGSTSLPSGQPQDHTLSFTDLNAGF